MKVNCETANAVEPSLCVRAMVYEFDFKKYLATNTRLLIQVEGGSKECLRDQRCGAVQ
mgnify:CR=1 FL=1